MTGMFEAFNARHDQVFKAYDMGIARNEMVDGQGRLAPLFGAYSEMAQTPAYKWFSKINNWAKERLKLNTAESTGGTKGFSNVFYIEWSNDDQDYHGVVQRGLLINEGNKGFLHLAKEQGSVDQKLNYYTTMKHYSVLHQILKHKNFELKIGNWSGDASVAELDMLMVAGYNNDNDVELPVYQGQTEADGKLLTLTLASVVDVGLLDKVEKWKEEVTALDQLAIAGLEINKEEARGLAVRMAQISRAIDLHERNTSYLAEAAEVVDVFNHES